MQHRRGQAPWSSIAAVGGRRGPLRVLAGCLGRSSARVLRRLLLPAALGVLAAGAHAAEGLAHTPAELRIGYERITLPGDEKMGLVGLTYLLEPAYGLQVGPAVYGAATGQRGGFFVPGIEMDWNTRLVGPLGLQAGLFAGGGGGANAPVGGGLMLRPQIGLWWAFKGFHLGVSASQVRFPSGDIDSRQLGLVFSTDTEFSYHRFGEGDDRGEDAVGLGFDRVMVVGGVYQPKTGSTGASGTPLRSRIAYAGARFDRFFAEYAFVGLEAAGAGSGGVAGYAEVLATLGIDVPLTPEGRFWLGARTAIGMAGGGDIPTGGGLLAKAAANATLRITRNVSVSVEGGIAKAPRGDFGARFVSAIVRWDLAQPGSFAPAGKATRQEWVGGVETYRNAARKSGPARSLQSVTFKVNRYVSENFYLSGQAHSAYQGGAGAFSVGLVGAGARLPLGESWHLGAEALAGAAGGGGVDSGGGAITQGLVYAGYALTPTLSAQIGAGRVKSLRGALNSPVIDLTLNFSFGVASR